MDTDSEAGSQAAEKKEEGPPWWKVEQTFLKYYKMMLYNSWCSLRIDEMIGLQFSCSLH